MPFTFAHPAIVLPFGFLPKKWFSMTGLIIGSLMPDFEYFLRFQIKSTFSHSILGVLFFCLPLGMLLATVFHNYIKNQLIDNLPNAIQQKCGLLLQLNWNDHFKKNSLVVIISIIIGSFSHLFWDNFTHHNGYFVSRIDVLIDVISYRDYDFYLYKILQHLSTLIGFIVIILSFVLFPNHKFKTINSNRNYWLGIIFSSILIFFIRFLFGLTIHQYGNIIVSLISSFIISLIIISVYFKQKLEPNA